MTQQYYDSKLKVSLCILFNFYAQHGIVVALIFVISFY